MSRLGSQESSLEETSSQEFYEDHGRAQKGTRFEDTRSVITATAVIPIAVIFLDD